MLPKSGKWTNHCSHRFAGIDAVVVQHPDEGFAARCLLCETVGPKRSNTVAARRALMNTLADTLAHDVDENFPGPSQAPNCQ